MAPLSLRGSQPLWKSGKTLKMSFQFSSQGKLRKKHQKSGKAQGICDSDPEGKGFRQFGIGPMCVVCHVSKLCSLTDCMVLVAFVNITHLNEKVFLIELCNFLREISGNVVKPLLTHSGNVFFI